MTESEKVLSAIEKDDLASAQVALQKALRSDSEASLAELGEDLQQLGFLEESKEVFTYLAKSYPENDGYFLPLALIPSLSKFQVAPSRSACSLRVRPSSVAFHSHPLMTSLFASINSIRA